MPNEHEDDALQSNFVSSNNAYKYNEKWAYVVIRELAAHIGWTHVMQSCRHHLHNMQNL